jgi:hypothetical protein
VSSVRLLPRALVVQVRRSLDAMRHERVCFERLSDGAAVLEYRNLTFHRAFRRRWGTERLRMYRESYLDGATMEEMKSRVGPSPTVKPLITRFLKMHT